MLQLVPIFSHNPASFCIRLAQQWPLSLSLGGHFIFLFLSLHFQNPEVQSWHLYKLMWAFYVFPFLVMKILSSPTWPGFDKIVCHCVLLSFTYQFVNISYLNVPPNVGVQKSTVVSWVTGNVLDTGTRHSPLLLRSCFPPSPSLDLPGLCIYNI